MFSPESIKKDFPIFQHHPQLVYLDSAATSLKPKQVIEAEKDYYEQIGATVHRGVYDLSVKATDAYEGAREKVRKFINAKSAKEIIFTRNTTEAINLVANTISQHLPKGSVILTTEMEHHSNIVPWQALTAPGATPPTLGGVELRWIPVTDDGQLDLSNLDELLKGVKLVTVTQMSNVLGTVNDVKSLAQQAHAVGALIMVDAAQSVPHMPVDVQDIDADFLVFSGHKMLAPTGIGGLYGKEEILKDLPPFLRGGDMILEVTKEDAKWNELPWKFEAGTPNIAGTIGLGAGVDYLSSIGMKQIWQHEQELTKYGLEQLNRIPGVTVLGPQTAESRGAVFSFTIAGVHPHDIGSILDEKQIAIRAGHHCAMVLHTRMGLMASARASGYLYNTKADIDALVKGITNTQELFA